MSRSLLLPFFLAAFTVLQCGEGKVAQVRQPPARSRLSIETVLVENDSFAPSTVVTGPSCDVALIGSIWGTVAVLHGDGSLDTIDRHIPGSPRFVSASTGTNEPVLLWSHEPDWWGQAGNRWQIASIPNPPHQWGGRWSGPAVALGAKLFAIAPLSDPSMARARPHTEIETPLISIVDDKGDSIGAIGAIEYTHGKYLPWVHAWLTLGAVAETLLTVNLTDGVLSAYAPLGGAGYSTVRRVELPKYLMPKEPAEEVRTVPWIEYGGDLTKITVVPQVTSAAFGPEGRLYAVRNYAVEWRPGGSPAFRTRGRWAVRDDGLEVYSSDGRLLGAYWLPQAGVQWLRVDGHGRIFIHSGSETLIETDPFFHPAKQKRECLRLPDSIAIAIRDRPVKPSAYP